MRIRSTRIRDCAPAVAHHAPDQDLGLADDVRDLGRLETLVVELFGSIEIGFVEPGAIDADAHRLEVLGDGAAVDAVLRGQVVDRGAVEVGVGKLFELSRREVDEADWRGIPCRNDRILGQG